MTPRSFGCLAVLVLVGGCGKALPFDDEDAGTSDAAIADAATGDAAVPESGTGASGCIEPNKVLEMKMGGGAELVHKVDADQDITRSDIDIDMSVVIGAGSWGGSGSYFDVLQVGYGDGYDYAQLPVTNLSVTPTTDLNVWRAKGTGSTYYTYRNLSPLVLPAGDVHVRVTIDWALAGSVAVAFNAEAKLATVATLEAPRQRRLTVVVGGSSSGTFPEHTLTVKRVCVALQ